MKKASTFRNPFAGKKKAAAPNPERKMRRAMEKAGVKAPDKQGCA